MEFGKQVGGPFAGEITVMAIHYYIIKISDHMKLDTTFWGKGHLSPDAV